MTSMIQLRPKAKFYTGKKYRPELADFHFRESGIGRTSDFDRLSLLQSTPRITQQPHEAKSQETPRWNFAPGQTEQVGGATG